MEIVKPKVLIAEDEVSIRTLLEFFLPSALNANVESFRSGQELSDRLTVGVEGVRLVFTDNKCGVGPNGIEIIDKFSKIYPHLPFVLASGDFEYQFPTSEEMIVAMESKGVRVYLSKPYDMKLLVDTLSPFLDGFRG